MSGMRLWQRRRRVVDREEQWASFAAELELEASAELAGRLRDHLDLGDGELRPVYALRRPNQPQLVLFDQLRERSGPTGAVRRLRTSVLLRTASDTLPASWRASARRNRVVESLEASRSGGVRLELADTAPDFDARVSVYAREVDEVRPILVPAVREVLLRLLAPFEAREGHEAASEPVELPTSAARSAHLVAGARSLWLWAEPDAPLPFDRLLDLTGEMLGLYAALCAVASAPRAGPAGGMASDAKQS